MGEQLHGRVVTANGVESHATVDIEDGLIAAVTPQEGPAPDGAPVLVPGFVDLHCHGGARGAFPSGDADSARTAALFHRSRGTTTLWASLVSGTEAELAGQLDVLADLVDEGLIDGVHLEGPFVNAARCGAQAPDRIQDGDPDMFARLLERSRGTVRQITFAPETPHARELLELCAAHRVIASLGHTDADAETTAAVLAAASECGATVTATHLFNAMPPLHHRAPGAAGALLRAAADGQIGAELIADGVHLADATVDMVSAAAPAAAFAVTDSMEAAGMPDGDYVLGPLAVVVSDGVARLRGADGTVGAIAGGTTALVDQYLRFAARHGRAAAARLTAKVAAAVRAAGREEEADRGDIAAGLRADIVALDADGAVRGVWLAGRRLAADGSDPDNGTTAAAAGAATATAATAQTHGETGPADPAGR